MTVRTRASSPEQMLDFLERQGSWSEEDYLSLTDHTSRLVEFADGYLEILAMPSVRHQKILGWLYRILSAFMDPLGGIVLFAPTRLQIRPGKYREPDLLLFRSAADARVQDRFLLGADFVLEVVSPDKPRRDLIDKRRDYARAGVNEHWIVNPLTEKITVLVLNKKRYRRLGIFGRGDKAESSLLKGFEVSVDEVFDGK